MKKIISLITLSILLSNVTNSYAVEQIDITQELTNVSVNNDVILAEVADEKFIYDLNNETITIGTTTIYLETTIEYIHPDITMTDEELIEYDKQITKNKFLNYKDQSTNVLSSSLDPQVPANAEYVTAVTYSKGISKIVDELHNVASHINVITSVVLLLTGIPTRKIIQYILTAYSATELAFSDIAVTVTGTWKYNLERTTKAYPAGITTQICYRYAHANLIMNVSCVFGAIPINKTQSAKGGWWVSSKPY